MSSIKIIFKMFVLVGVFVYGAKAYAQNAEMYWIDHKQDQNEIIFSIWKEGEWIQQPPIYASKNPLTSIAVATDLQGAKVILWTEMRGMRSILMKMEKPEGADKWLAPDIFNDRFKENFAATMVTDHLNQVWAFWAANSGELDDIYFSKRGKNGWSKPKLVHNSNKVPDVTPFAWIDDNYEVQVEWKSYSFAASDYVSASATFEVLPKPEQNQNKTFHSEVAQYDNVALPFELPSDEGVVIHYPESRFNQTELVRSERWSQ